MNDKMDKLMGIAKEAVTQYEEGNKDNGVTLLVRIANVIAMLQREIEGLSNFDGEKGGSDENGAPHGR